jgi:hypothetical protein
MQKKQKQQLSVPPGIAQIYILLKKTPARPQESQSAGRSSLLFCLLEKVYIRCLKLFTGEPISTAAGQNSFAQAAGEGKMSPLLVKSLWNKLMKIKLGKGGDHTVITC